MKTLNILQVRLMEKSNLEPQKWVLKYAKKIHELKNFGYINYVFEEIK